MLLPLKKVHERGCDVGRGESFFQQHFHKMILTLEVAGLQRGPELLEKRVGPRLFDFVRRGDLGPVNACLGVALDLLDLEEFTPSHERNRPA